MNGFRFILHTIIAASILCISCADNSSKSNLLYDKDGIKILSYEESVFKFQNSNEVDVNISCFYSGIDS